MGSMVRRIRRSAAAAIGAWLLAMGASAVGAATERASSPEELATVLGSAGPGTTVLLAPGDYGGLALMDLEGGPGAPITLRSADPGDPARFSGLLVRDSAHLALEGLVFDYDWAPGDRGDHRSFRIEGNRDVAITGAVFDGDEDGDGFPTAHGLLVRWVEGFTLEQSTLRQFYRGLELMDVSDATIRGNDVHAMRSDGMTFAHIRGGLIEGNHIHDFDRAVESGDHADMIQFWTTNGTVPTSDVTIRGNLLNSGTGWYTQSIFMRNERVDMGQAGREMFYRSIRIEGNTILNAHLHGITVGETDGLVIANNSVLRNARSEGPDDNPDLWTPMIGVSGSSTDVRIERNVAGRVRGFEDQDGWAVGDNLLVQDRHPSEPGFYGRVFAGFPGGNPGDPASFAPRPGGPLDGTGVGSPFLARIGR